jgi:hypothetical protein
MLYTDGEAQKLVAVAEAVVPTGKALPKREVFHRLNIDPHRLRDHRVSGLMNVYVENYQLSENYDLTWMASARDSIPLEDPDREIYAVRVVSRAGSEKR